MEKTKPQILIIDPPPLKMQKYKQISFSEPMLDFGDVQIGSLHRVKATICNPTATQVGSFFLL
jgi:hypothetical protein